MLLPTAALALLGGCGDGGGAAPGVVRDTLPNGAVRVRYASLPAEAALTVSADLEIGKVSGEPYEVFGDVRGIEAGPDGTIYILDFQAAEIRAFDAQGTYLGALTRRGEGPGELNEANGMVLSDGVLWVQDHRQWQMIGIDPDEGGEVGRVPMPVRAYGLIWNGTRDDRGRFWKPTSHSDDERALPPEEGLIVGSGRSYYKVYDPATETSDSVYLGEAIYRSHVSGNDRGGYSFRSIPYDVRPISLVDPSGGFWTVSPEAYRLARLDEGGDTVLVIEADVEPQPVTAEERAGWIEATAGDDPSGLRVAQEIAELMPETKPVIDQLVVDDRGRLWVRRVATGGEGPLYDVLYDVFDRDGTHHGSVRLAFQPAPYLPVRIRNGKLYALMLDSMNVPTVVRGQVPEVGGSGAGSLPAPGPR